MVYGHVARGIFNAGVEFPENLYRLADSVVYSFHMPLFFFLSGLFFCQSLSNRGGRNLIFNKIDIIVYPYLIWSIFQGCIEAYLSKYTNGHVSLYEVFSLLWNPRAQFWFLFALFLIFAVSTIIYSTAAKKHGKMIFILAALLYVYPGLLPDLNVFRFIAQGLVFFCFGIVFRQHGKIENISNFKVFFGILLVFLVGQWLFHSYFSLVYTDKGVASLMLAFISIIFIASISNILAQRGYKFLQFIGISSMAIYLMHILVGSGARIILNKVLHIDSLLVHLSIGCIIGVFVPLVALEMINKFKIPYVFSAPVCSWFTMSYNKALQRTNR